jgi:protein-disulfide isomerase|nr:thioredoxin domain-containing protein [Kofleriaceae bacterium]
MRALVVSLLLLAASATAAFAQVTGPSGHPSFDPDVIYQVPRGGSPTEGPADAPVTIVVWSDYACGHCNRVQPTLDQLARLYPGKLRFVHRALPLDADNTIAAEAALAAAAQGAFRPMHDRLYALRGNVDRPAVELIARQLDLDLARFRADLDTRAGAAAIAADVADARALGVSGTPTFFVDGRVVHGNQPLSVFAGAVDDGLARAAALAPSHPADLYDALVATGHPHADAPPDATNPETELDINQAYRVGLGLPGHQLGAVGAPVTIVEWSDFACPYCAQEAPVIRHAYEKHSQDVRVVYRHMPLHRDSNLAAEAAVAAGAQGKFWAFHDALFANFGHLTRDDLEAAAKTAGVDLAPFRAALDDRRYRDVVEADAADGSALGVDGTPTTFVDGHPINGAMDDATFDKMITGEIERAHGAMKAGVEAADLYALEMSSAIGSERADPSAIPSATAMHMEPTADDRERAVLAACRGRETARARSLARGLDGARRERVVSACSASGVDL